jgi:hypothetical protein
LSKDFEKLKKAQNTLATNPNDPAANFAVGCFYCFDKRDWDKGLALLVRGTDAALASLAKRDLQRPDTPAAQIEMADGWWTYAEKAEGRIGPSAHRRAYYWYLEALPGLKGSEAAHAERRTKEIANKLPGLKKQWDHCDIWQATSMKGFLRLQPGAAIVTRRPYAGPILITAVARTQENNIRLGAAGGGEVIFNWEGKAGEMRVHRPDDPQNRLGSLAGSAPVPLTPNTWYELSWRITERDMAVGVNRRTVFLEAQTCDLSVGRPFRVFATDSVVDVKSFTVKPIR